MSIKIVISSYSFFRPNDAPEGDRTPTAHQMIDRCVEYGVDGIELLWETLAANDLLDPSSLHEFHQYAAIRGITPVTVAASHNPVQVTEEARHAELDKLKQTIDLAAAVGAPFVRALGGRSNTAKSFMDLWNNNGEEPPLEGYTLDQGYEWAIWALTEGAAYAGKRGVTLVLENHWGLTGTAAGVKRIHDGVNSPWLKYVLDTGNFFQLADPYSEMEALFDDLAILHTKVYLGGGRIVSPEIDNARIARMLSDHGYNGFVSIEFEGRAHPRDGVPHGVETIRQAFQREQVVEP